MDFLSLAMINRKIIRLQDEGKLPYVRESCAHCYETTLNFSINEDFGGLLAVLLPQALGEETDTRWDVEWDRTFYAVKGDSSTGANWIGNRALAGDGEDTGEPFLFIVDFEQNMTAIIAAEPGDHLFKLLRYYETIIPINQKFIPPLDSLILNGADGKQYTVTVNESGTLVATPANTD